LTSARCVRPRSVLSYALALTLAACEAGGPVNVADAYRSAPQLDLVETQRFCTDDRIAACQLGPSAFASVAPDGGVILGMPSGPVARFDSAGAFVAEYGRAGGGPGEYRFLRGAHVLPDGRVVLHDGVSRRLLFAADGTPLATHSEDQGTGVRNASLEARGLAVLSDPPAEVGDSVRSEVRLLRDTLPAVVVARVPLTRLSNAMGMSPMIAFFEDRPRWAVESDSSALLTMGPVLSVRRYFPDGRGVDVVHAPDLGNRAVTPADIEAERARRGSPTGPIPPQMRQPLMAAMAEAEARAATVHPFAAELRALQDGAFLLRESEVRADSVRWTLFQPDGAILGQLRLPELAAVVGGRRDRLLIMMPDENDVPVVGWFDVRARDGSAMR
jgi:hypothetical protein